MKHRRHRTPTVEIEIRRRAAQIQRDQMSEAMLAAALMIVGKKLDEIKEILAASGLNSQMGPVAVRAIHATPSANDVAGVSAAPQIQHPCSYCGRESVYRTKPHRFNRTGTWLCQAHYPLRRQHEQGGTVVTAPEGEEIKVAPVPGVGPVVNGGPALPPDKPDTGGDVGIADAFAAVGIQTNAQQ